ncbi:hypothetical protein M885DRAFT_178933 [Pelagophyceae sp. CCMP2097]|nr:hypothetical protein M885DRAFT_178933 [Pelagophyceae sp. CCMP2097]
MLFVTSLLTPRVDAAAFVSKRFGEGPEAVGVLKALEAVCVVLVSLTPALQAKLVDTFGESGAAVAAAAAVAVGWLGIAAAPSMRALYVLVAARSAFAALYDPAARSLVWARARDTAKRTDATTGSLVGLQQSLKGASQVFGSWLGAYVTSLSVALPLGISAAMMFCNAGVILYECVWREAMRRTQIAEEVLRISASSDGLAQLRKRGLSLEFTRPRGSGSGDGGHPLSRKNSANSSSSSFASPIDMDDDDDGANGGSALPEWLRKSPSKHRPDEEDEDDEDSDDEWPPDEPIVAVFSAYVEKPGDGGAQGRRRCCSKRVRLVCRGDALQWTSSDGPQASSMSSAAEFPPSAWLKADAFEEVDDDVRVSDDDARVHDDGDATADADVGLQARSVGDVATWLRDRGQDAAAAQIVSAGVDGSALAVASVDELHEALGGNVPRLVCRSILLSAKTAFAADGPDGAASNGDGPAGGDSAVARLEHEAGGGLSPRGRAQALALRDGADADAPRLVVVAPHRAAVQTALLAFGSLDNRPAAAAGQRRRRKKREELVLSEPDDDATDGHRPVPIFVAHDAARPRDRAATRKKAGLVIAELHLEYGAQVDFAVCDHARAAVARRERTRSLSHESEDLLNFGGDASPLDEDESRASLARRVYGLLSFLRARAESDIAVVADQHVLDALVSDAARSKSAAVRRPFVAGELRELRVDFFAGADDAPSF